MLVNITCSRILQHVDVRDLGPLGSTLNNFVTQIRVSEDPFQTRKRGQSPDTRLDHLSRGNVRKLVLFESNSEQYDTHTMMLFVRFYPTY